MARGYLPIDARFGARDFGLRKLQMDYVTGFYAMRNAIDSLATGGGQLTSGFESTMVASGKTANEFGVRMGMVGTDLKQFTKQASSMAYGLNLGVEDAAKAIYAYQQKSDLFQKLGLANAESIAQFGRVTGVDVKDLVNQFKFMGKALSMSDEEINNIVDSFHAMGESTNDIPGAFEMLKDVNNVLLRQQSVLRQQFQDPKELAQMTTLFARQIAGVSGALREYTMDAGQARALSLELADGLTMNAEAFRTLEGGGEATINQLESLATAVGVTGAKEMLAKGPLGFLQTLMQTLSGQDAKEAQKTLSIVQTQIEKGFGKNFMLTLDAVVGQGQDAVRKMADNMNMIANSTDKSLFALATLDRDGLTFQERVERQYVAFQQKLRSYSGSEQDYYNTRKKAFKELAAGLDNLAKKEGILGEIPKILANINKYGAMGLFGEEFAAKTSVLGQALQSLQGPLQSVYTMFMLMQAVLTPGGILFVGMAAIAGLFTKNYAALEDFDKAAEKTFEDFGGFVSKGIDIAAKAVSAFFKFLTGDRFKEIMSSAIKILKDSLPKIVETISSAFPKLLDLAVTVFKALGSIFGTLFDSIDFNKLFKTVFESIGISISKLIQYVGDVFSDSAFTGRISKFIGSLLGGIVSGLGKIFGDPKTIQALQNILGGLVRGVGSIISKLLEVISSPEFMMAFNNLVGTVASLLKTGISSILGEVFDIDKLKKVFLPALAAIAGGIIGGPVGAAIGAAAALNIQTAVSEGVTALGAIFEKEKTAQGALSEKAKGSTKRTVDVHSLADAFRFQQYTKTALETLDKGQLVAKNNAGDDITVTREDYKKAIKDTLLGNNYSDFKALTGASEDSFTSMQEQLKAGNMSSEQMVQLLGTISQTLSTIASTSALSTRNISNKPFITPDPKGAAR